MPKAQFLSRMREAIASQDWSQFKELESVFVDSYSIETWEDIFNFQLLPRLTSEDRRWILVQKCDTGIKSIKILKSNNDLFR